MKLATNITLLFSVLIFPSYLFGQPMTKLVDIGGIQHPYVYVGGDEFSFPNTFDDQWDWNFPWGMDPAQTLYVNREDNIVYNNGVVELYLKEESWSWPYNDIMYDWAFTGAALFSKRMYKDVYVEISTKMDAIYGTWPAFWMYGDKGDEIDIFENGGNLPNRTTNNFHYFKDLHCSCSNSCHVQDLQTPPISPGIHQAFNHWSFVYESSVAGAWYQNGVLIRAEPFSGFCLSNVQEPKFDQSFWIIANHQVGKPGSPWPGPPLPGTFPAKMEIDYIRVYKFFKCDDDQHFCEYVQDYDQHPSSFTGKNIVLGGAGCNFLLQNSMPTNAGNDYYGVDFFHLVASESITLSSNITIEPGSEFSARIETCPTIPGSERIQDLAYPASSLIALSSNKKRIIEESIHGEPNGTGVVQNRISINSHSIVRSAEIILIDGRKYNLEVDQNGGYSLPVNLSGVYYLFLVYEDGSTVIEKHIAP